MAKKVSQIRYYGVEGHENNFPLNITKENLVSGEIFQNFLPLYQLGVQAPQGTTFYLGETEDQKVVIGKTGIYQLNLMGGDKIKSLRFAPDPWEDNMILLIDLIYEGV